jgi:hypothetical protein
VFACAVLLRKPRGAGTAGAGPRRGAECTAAKANEQKKTTDVAKVEKRICTLKNLHVIHHTRRHRQSTLSISLSCSGTATARALLSYCPVVSSRDNTFTPSFGLNADKPPGSVTMNVAGWER